MTVTNSTVLETYIQDNYKDLLGFSLGYTKNKQIAEDCLQLTCETLLKKQHTIDINNMRSYIRTAITNHFLNYKRSNRRYHRNEMDYFDTDTESYETDSSAQNITLLIEEATPESLYDIKQMLATLADCMPLIPKAQLAAVQRRMLGTHPNTHTEKANYRHGMIKLKKLMYDRTGET